MGVSWRLLWYGVFLWLLILVASVLVIIPWYYLVLPSLVFLTTVLVFRKIVGTKVKNKNYLVYGLNVAVVWFSIFGFLDFLQLVGPYYFNLGLYFSDVGNWFRYYLVLLTPVIHGLVLENENLKRNFKRRYRGVYYTG